MCTYTKTLPAIFDVALGKQGDSMISLGAGHWLIEIDGDDLDDSYVELGKFLQSINEPVRENRDVHFRLGLTAGHGPAHIFVDSDQNSVILRLPLSPIADMHVARIALLQAAFRGFALLTDDPALVLLHGSAVATRDSRIGIGIIDGATGAGKTSLSLALAELGYPLITDEFLTCEAKTDHLAAFSQPNLPWHIRPDMAPHLSISENKPGLRAFPQLTSPYKDIPIRVLVIPDWSLSVSTCVVDPGRAPDSCLTDHLKKFADPSLDHVSIFTQNRDSLTIRKGYGLHALLEHRIAAMRYTMLRIAKSFTLLRVGIGSPNEVSLAAQAVATHLDNLSP